MKLTKSKILVALSLLMGTAFANDPSESTPFLSQQFGYVGIGVGPLPVPVPFFSTGYRIQTGHHGADMSLQVATIIALNQFKTNFLYHHYFKPHLSSEFYVGGGIGTSYLWGSSYHRGLLSPELVFGKQYRNESGDLRFFQLQTSFPTFSWGQHHNRLCYYPLVTISYGIGF